MASFWPFCSNSELYLIPMVDGQWLTIKYKEPTDDIGQIKLFIFRRKKYEIF